MPLRPKRVHLTEPWMLPVAQPESLLWNLERNYSLLRLSACLSGLIFLQEIFPMTQTQALQTASQQTLSVNMAEVSTVADVE